MQIGQVDEAPCERFDEGCPVRGVDFERFFGEGKDEEEGVGEEEERREEQGGEPHCSLPLSRPARRVEERKRERHSSRGDKVRGEVDWVV
jgi:hypothetical protein